MLRKSLSSLTVVLVAVLLLGTGSVCAQEVNKGEIPAEHLQQSCKALPWGVTVWDLNEALVPLKEKEQIIWVDTRPGTFFEKGTVQGALLMPYNKSGQEGNDLTRETLEKAISSAGLTKDTAKIVFFCQGPTCHRSYNASYVAVKAWGFNPKNVYWFRDGYPVLFKAVKDDPKMKRKAKLYLSDSALSQL